jgi:hypothetical protein
VVESVAVFVVVAAAAAAVVIVVVVEVGIDSQTVAVVDVDVGIGIDLPTSVVDVTDAASSLVVAVDVVVVFAVGRYWNYIHMPEQD